MKYNSDPMDEYLFKSNHKDGKISLRALSGFLLILNRNMSTRGTNHTIDKTFMFLLTNVNCQKNAQKTILNEFNSWF